MPTKNDYELLTQLLTHVQEAIAQRYDDIKRSAPVGAAPMMEVDDPLMKMLSLLTGRLHKGITMPVMDRIYEAAVFLENGGQWESKEATVDTVPKKFGENFSRDLRGPYKTALATARNIIRLHKHVCELPNIELTEKIHKELLAGKGVK